MRRKLTLWTLAFGLASAGGGAPAVEIASFDHQVLDGVLRAVVVEDSVDYRRLRDEHLGALDGYLDALADVDPAGMERAERLALYVNLYNATVLAAVARRYGPGYRVSEDEFALFDEPLVRIAARRITLNDLEHGLIRKQFDDPRIHAALVCAARSCPPLLGRAYEGATLDEQLERRMRAFVGDPARNTIDPAQRRLELSRIFDWYAEDFGGHEQLSAYVDRYTDRDVEGFAVGFKPYSWELNDAGRSGASDG